MPTYQYRCKSCGHDLEVVQGFTDDPLATCPECQGDLRKVYGNVGISFKGGGFYKTDTRTNGKSTSSASSASSSESSGSTTGDSSGSSGSSSESKAAATTSGD